MCGLITIKNNNGSVNEEMMDQLEDQLHRGEKGFGMLMVDKEMNVKEYRATEINKILIDLNLYKSNFIMLHHRFPTSSENKISQTHPLLISHKDLKNNYYVIHNGVISNCDKLRKEHEARGYVYKTVRKNSRDLEEYNDSESFAIELAEVIDGKKDKIEAVGSMAFIAISVDKKSGKAIELHYGTKTNPLKLAEKNGYIMLSSEGKGNSVNPEMLYSIDLKTEKKSKKKITFAQYEFKKSSIGFNTYNYNTGWHNNYTQNSLPEPIAKEEEEDIDKDAYREEDKDEEARAEFEDMVIDILGIFSDQIRNEHDVWELSREQMIEETLSQLRICMEDEVKRLEDAENKTYCEMADEWRAK